MNIKNAGRPTRDELVKLVNDGEIADQIVANAPGSEDHFFVVPKVVE